MLHRLNHEENAETGKASYWEPDREEPNNLN
jgi:hypothetical protein